MAPVDYFYCLIVEGTSTNRKHPIRILPFSPVCWSFACLSLSAATVRFFRIRFPLAQDNSSVSSSSSTHALFSLTCARRTRRTAAIKTTEGMGTLSLIEMNIFRFRFQSFFFCYFPQWRLSGDIIHWLGWRRWPRRYQRRGDGQRENNSAADFSHNILFSSFRVAATRPITHITD